VDESLVNKVIQVLLNFNILAKNLLPPSSTTSGKRVFEPIVRFQNSTCEDAFDLQTATRSDTKDENFQKWMEEVTIKPQGPPL